MDRLKKWLVDVEAHLLWKIDTPVGGTVSAYVIGGGVSLVQTYPEGDDPWDVFVIAGWNDATPNLEAASKILGIKPREDPRSMEGKWPPGVDFG